MTWTWDALHALERRFGDTYFLVDLGRFERNYSDLLAAFRASYPNTQLAYSYKTNYLPRFCHIVDRLGGYAEVVSDLEYALARRLGVAGPRIVLNGPHKDDRLLADALAAGAIVNLDQPYQLDTVVRLAAGGARGRVGLRCNFAAGGAAPSRFGFDADSGELAAARDRLRAVPGITIAGLHCHFVPPHRSCAEYEAIARRMTALAGELFDDALAFIDVGGGFFSRMPDALAASFGVDIPSFAAYGRAIGDVFAERYGDAGPELILEPGLAIAADAMRYVTRVLDVRVLRGRGLAQVAGSAYEVKPSLHGRNPPVSVVEAPGGSPRAAGPHDVTGYTCMEHDVLLRGLSAPLAAGDYLVFDNAGAYTNVLKPPFIRAAPAILGARPGEPDVEVLRRRETLDELMASYER